MRNSHQLPALQPARFLQLHCSTSWNCICTRTRHLRQRAGPVLLWECSQGEVKHLQKMVSSAPQQNPQRGFECCTMLTFLEGGTLRLGGQPASARPVLATQSPLVPEPSRTPNSPGGGTHPIRHGSVGRRANRQRWLLPSVTRTSERLQALLQTIFPTKSYSADKGHSPEINIWKQTPEHSRLTLVTTVFTFIKSNICTHRTLFCATHDTCEET